MDCKEYRKIVNSNLLGTWIKYLDTAIATDSTPLKWLMLSAHDTNLGYVLPILNITNTECLYNAFLNKSQSGVNCQPAPPFTASLILELRQKQDSSREIFVQLKYNGDYQLVCDSSTSKQCSYTEFKERILNSIYTPEEFNSVCNVT
jgi:hypothetical protein